MRHRAISMLQPWPQLILDGRKTIEIRGRPISHRGPLLICSSKKEMAKSALPKGVAICLVDVVGCRKMIPSDIQKAFYPYSDESWAWELSNPRPVPNIKICGKQGIFFVDLNILT